MTVAIVSNAVALREVRAIQSAFPEAIGFVKDQDDPRISAAWSSSVRCYAMESEIEGGSLYRYIGEDETPPRWFVNDWQELYDRRYPDECIALTDSAMPVHTMTHQFGRIFLVTEALPSYGNTFENLRWVRGLDLQRARNVLMYDLHSTSLRSDEN